MVVHCRTNRIVAMPAMLELKHSALTFNGAVRLAVTHMVKMLFDKSNKQGWWQAIYSKFTEDLESLLYEAQSIDEIEYPESTLASINNVATEVLGKKYALSCEIVVEYC